MSWVFLFTAVILNSAGNILIKASAQPDVQGISMYLSVPFISGAMLFGLNLVAYAKAQTTIPLTVAYCVLVGSSVIVVSLYGFIILKEVINFSKIGGMLLMLLGIYFVVRT